MMSWETSCYRVDELSKEDLVLKSEGLPGVLYSKAFYSRGLNDTPSYLKSKTTW